MAGEQHAGMEASPTGWFGVYAFDDLEVATFTIECGISYLRPEVQLLHKALLVRPDDQADFDACLPLLADTGRRWLVAALRIAHPGHPWLELLG